MLKALISSRWDTGREIRTGQGKFDGLKTLTPARLAEVMDVPKEWVYDFLKGKRPVRDDAKRYESHKEQLKQILEALLVLENERKPYMDAFEQQAGNASKILVSQSWSQRVKPDNGQPGRAAGG